MLFKEAEAYKKSKNGKLLIKCHQFHNQNKLLWIPLNIIASDSEVRIPGDKGIVKLNLNTTQAYAYNIL
tara:strand:+ start:6118 stop:6324 length:207 start_codon:yes stop_codon:yes gene_type:complete